LTTLATHAAPPSAVRFPLAFITGCGRSGTTILGQILAKHPEVRYLNDRFDLWVDVLPVTDIWGQGEGGSPARVALSALDARALDEEARHRFAARLEAQRQGRTVLIEKLAINNFRLGFILELCPGAALINIVRHGVEVARSIQHKAQAGQWYGRGDRKWALLCEHAEMRGLGHLLPLCTGPYEKGLLEWRLSVEAAEEFFTSNPSVPALHLCYEQLLGHPSAVCQRLQEFLGLAPSTGLVDFCQREVRRQNPAAHERPVPPSTDVIAGETLRRMGYGF
jgi:hypothetical protein